MLRGDFFSAEAFSRLGLRVRVWMDEWVDGCGFGSGSGVGVVLVIEVMCGWLAGLLGEWLVGLLTG